MSPTCRQLRYCFRLFASVPPVEHQTPAMDEEEKSRVRVRRAASPDVQRFPAMGDQIDFDERLAAQLEVVYRTRDIKRRRALAQEALAPEPGDEVLDVGLRARVLRRRHP